jgi:cell shape-determining protein MreD
MNWMQSSLLFGFALVAVFGEATIDWPRRWLGVSFDLLPGLLVYAGLSSGAVMVGLLAVLAGLWFDSLSANPLGISVLPLGIIGLLAQQYRDLVMRGDAGVQMALGFLASLLFPGLTLLLLVSLGQEPIVGWTTLGQVFVLGLGGALATPALFLLLDRLNRAFSYPTISEPSFRHDREIKRGRY